MQLGLIGWPVRHSLSPAMHEAAFEACGIAATYQLRETPPDRVAETVEAMRHEGFRGWNVTVPHKAAMARLVDEAAPVAKSANSVNTVVVEDDGLKGYSTDGYGLEQALLEAFGIEVPRARVAFVGAGGAARACCLYFAERGVGSLVIANRTLNRAEALLEDVRRFRSSVGGEVCSLTNREASRRALATADVLVQATSLGLHEADPSPVPADALPAGIPAMDMIYRQTAFLELACAAGAPVADGRGMLLHQGARSFELWTGLDAPVEAMRRGLDGALKSTR